MSSLDTSLAGWMRWALSTELAQGGSNFEWVLPILPAYLAAWTDPDPTHVLVNFFATTGRDYAVDLADFVDQVHTKFPSAVVYVTRPWWRGEGGAADTMAGQIATVCSTRAAYCKEGDDERVWLENGDDGVSRTVDGVHYNAAGQAVAPVVKATAMGY